MARMPALADLAGVSKKRLPLEPPPPEIPPHSAVFLLDASTGLEDRLLRAWIDRQALVQPLATIGMAPSRIRRRGRRTDLQLSVHLRNRPDAWVVPLRVAWMPAERHGRRVVSWIDALKLGDPRDPRWLRDYLILALHPDRVRIVVAKGASAGELLSAHAESVDDTTLEEYVTRRARRALDRAERSILGDRYKISRFVAEDIAGRPMFRRDAIRFGQQRGLPEATALARARHYLREIAASHSPFVIDLVANFVHRVFSQGYGAIRYDRDAIAPIAQLGRDHPVAFLPSHRSNLDRLALQFMLWENDLPPNHTAGGINLNFFPVGPLIRRTGVFFIRRSFKGNDLYRFVLRSYLDYLIQKRFPLEWYMEGGRSRSGRLRPPRFGMLSWVIDSVARGMSEDLYLLPVSIAYDHIHDVKAYATEASGGSKEKESLSWTLKFIRGLRRRYGDIHISFAEPISLTKVLGGPDAISEVDRIEVRKLAFEVMYRIGSVTPVTPTAVVSIALLSAKGEARRPQILAETCQELIDFIDRNHIPTTSSSLPRNKTEVVDVIAGMEEHGLVSSHTAAGDTVYWMEPDQMLRASYYRNTVVHYFVPRGLAEIALAAPDMGAFWSDLMDLRDLLKFEFFFADKDEFRHLVSTQLDTDVPGWQESVSGGTGHRLAVRPSTASWAVVPLLEAYLVVADELAGTEGEVEEKPFMAACLNRGRLYRLEGRITSEESVSKAMFDGALLLARNRGLTDHDTDPGTRRGFADEIAAFLERV